MSSSPTKAQGYNRSKPPPYTFASPVNSVFSSTSDESIITTSEISSEIDGPRVYDALPATVFVNHPSRSVHSSSTRRASLPKLITGSTPTHTSFWEHPAIRDDLSTRLFSDRTSHLHTIFRLSTDRFKPILDGSTDEVTRLAIWWFIHGRMQLQAVIRDTSLERSQESETQVLVRKAHTDISKALWILQEVFSQPLSSNIGKNATHLRNYQHLLLSKIGKTIESMGKHGLMPEDNSEAVFSPNNDGSIWIEYPSVGIDVSFLLTGCISSVVEEDRFDTNLLEHMLLGTSESFFYYTALPVDVYIFNESSNSQQIKYPTLLSVVRARDDPQISMTLASQDGRLNFCVKPEKELKSTWDNVTWLDGICSLEVKLPTGFRLQIRCDELDFKTLSDMYQHHNNANTLFEPGMEEQVAFQTEIESVECRRTLNESLRPATDSARHCRLRLFHRTITRAEGTGPRRMYRGSRLVILTPTTSKNLSVLEHQIWPDHVIEFGFLRGRNGQPTIFLRIDRNDPSAMTVLSFSTLEQCNMLLAHLTGPHLSEEEDIFAEAQLNSFSLAVGLEILGQSGTLGPSPWQRLRVINSKAWHESDPDVESCTTVLSESLRIVLDSPNTRLTDRLNLGIGELKIRRNVVASGHELHILREHQKDLTYSQSVLSMITEDHNDLTKTLSALQTQPSIRTFSFPNLSELHQFQAAITGFSVLFDGTPTSFSISRRRLLVPKSKEWESRHTRIQLLRRREAFQLVAFFEGFKHGKCMNFMLRKTDSLRMIKSGNKTLVRLVDAKFSLPFGEHRDSGVEQGFVCVDALDYPSENNDITIGFESYSDYSKFAQALPAPVKTR